MKYLTFAVSQDNQTTPKDVYENYYIIEVQDDKYGSSFMFRHKETSELAVLRSDRDAIMFKDYLININKDASDLKYNYHKDRFASIGLRNTTVFEGICSVVQLKDGSLATIDKKGNIYK